MSMASENGDVIFSDNSNWIYSAFGAIKDAKNKNWGCILLCGEIKM